jgi:hypothetical protein
VAVARENGTIQIHDLPRNTAVVLSNLPSVRRLAFSADGSRLAAALGNNSVRLWARNGEAWSEVLTLPADGSAGLAFSDEGKALATAAPRQVVVWGVVE